MKKSFEALMSSFQLLSVRRPVWAGQLTEHEMAEATKLADRFLAGEFTATRTAFCKALIAYFDLRDVTHAAIGSWMNRRREARNPKKGANCGIRRTTERSRRKRSPDKAAPPD